VTAYDRLPLLAEDLGAMKDVRLVRDNWYGDSNP